MTRCRVVLGMVMLLVAIAAGGCSSATTTTAVVACTGGTIVKPTLISVHAPIVGTMQVGPITWTDWGATSASGVGGSGSPTSTTVTLSGPMTYKGSRVYGGIRWSNFPTVGIPTWCGEQ